MAKYIPDISSRRWVIVAPSRIKRPDQDSKNNKKEEKCPLCPGNENMTPPEVYRVGEGDKNASGWKVRVVPNKFSITDIHEVIVHSPSHNHNLEDLPLDQVKLIFATYRERFNFYRKSGQVMIFCNSGERAGASLQHSHSQLVVLPWQINLDTLLREPLANLVLDNTYFNVYCPDFSQWPYEVWVAPKVYIKKYGDISDDQIEDLAKIIIWLISRLKKIHSKSQFVNIPFSYNYYIYPKADWYLRLIPRFVHRAGFELGTGLQVNVIDPCQAAEDYKGGKEKIEKVMTKLKLKIR